MRSVLPRFAPRMVSVGLLVLAADAWGACAAPYTTDNLLADLTSTEKAVRGKDSAASGAGAGKLEAGLPCLDGPLPRPIAGKAYRAIGGGFVVAGDAAKGQGWLTTAAELEPTFAYGVEDLPNDHPVRPVYDAAKLASGGDDVVLGPVTGEVFVDGRKMTTEIKAKDGRPHVVQHKTEAGLAGWLVQGVAFPPEVVPPVKGGGDKPAKEPKPAKPPKGGEVTAAKPPKGGPTTMVDENGMTIVKRKRPWEKTPLLIGGAAVVVGGGAVYGLSFLTRQKFEEATTKADVELYSQRTNTYVIASLAVLGVGAGTLTWGAILSESGPVAGLNFKF